MVQTYFTREEMLQIYKEEERAMANPTKEMPKVVYAVRDIEGRFSATPYESDAIIMIADDLENLFDIDYESVPLAFTDRSTKFGWEQCWYEKVAITPCA